jgi:hypothetical protein
MNETTTIYIASVLGIVARTLVPFLLTIKDNPETKFDRKFLVPVIISVVINLLVAPFVFEQLPAGATWTGAFIFGWGTTDISRDAMKLVGGSVPALSGVK